MANIKLKQLLETAVERKPLKEINFGSQNAFDDYIKQHDLRPDTKVTIRGKAMTVAQARKNSSEPAVNTKPNDMFGGDYAKDRGGEAPSDEPKVRPQSKVQDFVKNLSGKQYKEFAFDNDIDHRDPMEMQDFIESLSDEEAEEILKKYGQAPKANTTTKSKYDDKSYWKDVEREKQGQGANDDWDDDDSWGEGPQLTSDRLNKIETALEDELDLRGNGFETTRESGGGMGGWEGPMQIMDKNADFDDEDNYITLSVGSSNNDGKMSILFANYNGEPYFEPDYDALTGDNDLEPQQAYKVTKALMKMPEVQKLLKGEMSKEEFQPIYDKLKAKFSKGKTESTKLTSMIKR